MKTIKPVLCLVLAVLLLFGGCSSGNETKESAVETQPTTQEETTYPVATTVPPMPASPDSLPDDSNLKLNNVEIKNNLNEIESTIDNLQSYHGFEGALYTKIGNDFEYLNATGIANKGAHINNSVYTRFYTGSLTKVMTAVAVMKLSEEKKLSLDDTLGKYFPDCAYAKSVTVRQLLTMTSGIPDYVRTSDIAAGEKALTPALAAKVSSDNTAEKNRAEILGWILSQKRSGDKEAPYAFSDSNYFLLGEIVAKTSGKSYEEYLNEEIFHPLYMTKTGFASDESTARPYNGSQHGAQLLYQGVGYASFGMISNVSDLLKLIDGLLSYQIITQDSLKAIMTDYGNGWGYGAYVNGNRLSALGSVDAYSAKLSFTTDKSQIFVALTNNADCDPNFIHRLLRNYLVKYRN